MCGEKERELVKKRVVEKAPVMGCVCSGDFCYDANIFQVVCGVCSLFLLGGRAPEVLCFMQRVHCAACRLLA
jgi:hypothetical protein